MPRSVERLNNQFGPMDWSPIPLWLGKGHFGAQTKGRSFSAIADLNRGLPEGVQLREVHRKNRGSSPIASNIPQSEAVIELIIAPFFQLGYFVRYSVGLPIHLPRTRLIFRFSNIP